MELTTCSSTTSAPALRKSVRTLGEDVNRRPRARSASTKFQGPWQIAATGLSSVVPAFLRRRLRDTTTPATVFRRVSGRYRQKCQCRQMSAGGR